MGRAISAPPTSTTPRSPEQGMLRATGGSSSSTSLRATATATTTTLRPPGWRPARPPTVPAGCWLLATSPSAPRSTSTTGCSPSTLATPTGASSLTPTSCPAPAPATSPRPSLLLFPSFLFSQNPQPTVTEENHGPHVVLVENLPFIYSYLFFAQKPKSVRASSSRRPPTELHNIWAAAWTERSPQL